MSTTPALFYGCCAPIIPMTYTTTPTYGYGGYAPATNLVCSGCPYPCCNLHQLQSHQPRPPSHLISVSSYSYQTQPSALGFRNPSFNSQLVSGSPPATSDLYHYQHQQQPPPPPQKQWGPQLHGDHLPPPPSSFAPPSHHYYHTQYYHPHQLNQDWGAQSRQAATWDLEVGKEISREEDHHFEPARQLFDETPDRKAEAEFQVDEQATPVATVSFVLEVGNGISVDKRCCQSETAPTYIYPTSHCEKVGYAAPPSPCLTMHTQTVSAAADPYATSEATTQYTCGSPTSFLPQTMGKDRDAQSRMLKPRPTTTWKKRKTLLCNSDLGFYRARKVFDIMPEASGLGGAYYFRNRRAGSTTEKPWGSQSSTSHLRGHQDAQKPTMRGTGGSGRGAGKSGASQAVDSRKLVGRGSGWQQATARNYDNRSMAPQQAIPPKLERGWHWQSRAAPTQPKGPEVNRDNYNHVVDDDKDVVSETESDDDDLSDEFDILNGGLGDKVLEQDDVVVLNTLLNPDNALLALNYFQRIFKPKREVVLYNVTLKVFRKCKDLERAEKLFYEMLQRGVTPDNVTFSTLISCARMCYLPDKAVELFEKMHSYGCNSDDVTYSAMIDTYGSAGNVDKAFSLYDRARTEKLRIDPVTFATLIKIHDQSGNYDGCLNVYEEMKAIGVKPNMVIYNTLLDAMGRAKRPWQAKKIYQEMISKGSSPNWVTYASLLRAFCRARYGDDALNVYKKMKENRMEMNVILYNTLLSMCADIGYTDQAMEIFKDMKSSETLKPDSWTFSSMITIYSCSGKVSEAERMLKKFFEVLGSLTSKFELRLFCRTVGVVAMLKLCQPNPDDLGYVDSISGEEIAGTDRSGDQGATGSGSTRQNMNDNAHVFVTGHQKYGNDFSGPILVVSEVMGQEMGFLDDFSTQNEDLVISAENNIVQDLKKFTDQAGQPLNSSDFYEPNKGRCEVLGSETDFLDGSMHHTEDMGISVENNNVVILQQDSLAAVQFGNSLQSSNSLYNPEDLQFVVKQDYNKQSVITRAQNGIYKLKKNPDWFNFKLFSDVGGAAAI